MDKFSYQEFVKEINKQFKDNPDAQVTIRTIKFWVKDRLLPEPKGSGRWRYFDNGYLKHAVSLRKLQVFYGQSLEDIKKLIALLVGGGRHPGSGDPYTLDQLTKSVELLDRVGINAITELDAYKRHERQLICDSELMPGYQLISHDELANSYVEEDGKVYRLLPTIAAPDGGKIYYTLEQIEQCIIWVNSLMTEGNSVPSKPRDEAEKLRQLIESEIMTSPRYRYKGKAYLSRHDIYAGQRLLNLQEEFGLDIKAMKLLRSRIEEDIAEFFYAPERGFLIKASIVYKFQKQVPLFNDALRFLLSHLVEDGHTSIRDYMDGFYFLCQSMNYVEEFYSMCIKRTPIDRLSANQIKIGLSQGKFSLRDAEKVLKARETEVKAFKSIVSKSMKGGGRGR